LRKSLHSKVRPDAGIARRERNPFASSPYTELRDAVSSPIRRGLPMSQLKTGLRHRVRRAVRQMAKQHEHLRALHRALAEAIAGGRVAQIEESVDRLRSAIDAHFSLEDGVFFPAVHGLHPDSAPELHALMREHADYLEDLSRFRDGLATGTTEAFAKRYEALSQSFANHEYREERLIASLTYVFDTIR
jgi:hypothetical protein